MRASIAGQALEGAVRIDGKHMSVRFLVDSADSVAYGIAIVGASDPYPAVEVHDENGKLMWSGRVTRRVWSNGSNTVAVFATETGVS